MTDIDEKLTDFPPKRCKMPDLSNLFDKNILNLILNIFFRGGGPKDHKVKALWINYIRVVDHLIREYKYAHASLKLYVTTPNNVISPLFICIGHLESCIGLMKRAIYFARKIRRGMKIGKYSVLSSAIGDRITNLRNAIEHLDDYIIKSKISQGSPIALIVKKNSIELAGNEIYFSELAEWIKELHEIAEKLVNYIDNN